MAGVHPPKAQASVSCRLLWPLLRVLDEQSRDSGATLQAAGLSRSYIEDADHSLPHDRFYSVFADLCSLSDDAAVGVCAGLATRESDLGLLHYLVMTSGTLREALSEGARYVPLLSEDIQLELRERGDAALLRVTANGAPGVAMDALLGALLVTLGSRLNLDTTPEQTDGVRPISASQAAAVLDQGVLLEPRELHVARPPPADPARYEQLLGVPIRYGAQAYGLVLARAALDVSLVKADAEVHRMLERNAQRVLATRASSPGYTQRVREMVSSLLSQGNPTINEVARALSMSRSTLNRRLRSEGTHFKEVVDRLRWELALEYLEESDLAVSEIAYFLGFSDVGAFHRAFRRWTDHSPGHYRRRSRRPG